MTLTSSVRLVADIAPPPPKPREGQMALAGGGVILRKNGLEFA
jgi:hypothetical protein